MKNKVLNLIFFCGSLMLGACIEIGDIVSPAFGKNGGLSGGGGYYGGDYTNFRIPPQLHLDSATNITDSTFTLWVHVMYDSTVVFESCDLEYQFVESAALTFYEEFQLTDTVDFTSLASAYRFKLDLDSLQSNSFYIFYGGIRYYDDYGAVTRQPSANSIIVKTSP